MEHFRREHIRCRAPSKLPCLDQDHAALEIEASLKRIIGLSVALSSSEHHRSHGDSAACLMRIVIQCFSGLTTTVTAPYASRDSSSKS